MKKTKGFTQYLIGALFVAFSLYQMTRNNIWEFTLYALAGASFITIGLIKDEKFKEYEKPLSIISWILILGTGFILLFLIRTDG